jgi:hypothetical protein
VHTKNNARRAAALVAAAIAVSGATVLASAPAQASETTCTTVNLDNGGYWWSMIRPTVSVPICYNGSQIWQNGNVTGGVDTTGYVLDEITWTGTYNSGGSWLGVGENYRVTDYSGVGSFSCASRWMLDASGNKTSFDRAC